MGNSLISSSALERSRSISAQALSSSVRGQRAGRLSNGEELVEDGAELFALCRESLARRTSRRIGRRTSTRSCAVAPVGGPERLDAKSSFAEGLSRGLYGCARLRCYGDQTVIFEETDGVGAQILSDGVRKCDWRTDRIVGSWPASVRKSRSTSPMCEPWDRWHQGWRMDRRMAEDDRDLERAQALA